MSDTETTEPEVRYMTPPEYVKWANARDRREKHSLDLHHFMAFYRDRQGHQGMNQSTVTELIDDYLDEVEPSL